MKLMLPDLEDDPGINSALAEICQVLRVGFEDKIAQVKKRKMYQQRARYGVVTYQIPGVAFSARYLLVGVLG